MPNQTHPTPFPLFQLPAQLRLQVYYFAFLHPRSPIPNTITIGTEKFKPTHKTRTNLLRASKQIHTEALPVLYTRLTFRWPVWTSHDFAFQFIASLTPDARGSIRKIALEMVHVTPVRQKQARTLKLWRAGYQLIARELTGLECVILFVGGSRKWDDRLRRIDVMDEAVAIFGVFKGVERFDVVGLGDGDVDVVMGEEVRRRLRSEMVGGVVHDVGEGWDLASRF